MTGLEKKGPIYWIHQFRKEMADSFHSIFPPREAGLIEAIVTGEKSGMDPELKELYSNGGISHILAVSGLHVSIMAGILKYVLESIFKFKKHISAIITITFLGFFLVFTGGQPSSTRAVIMMSIFLMGTVIKEDSDGVNSLGVAAMILLTVQPLYLWDIGFQFSFVTTLAILLANNITIRSKRLPSWAQYLFISSVASAASFPLNAWYFYFIPFHAIFINILVLPLMGIVTGIGFFVGVLGMFWIQAGIFFGGIVFVLLRFYEAVCTFFVNQGWFLLQVGRPAFWVMILFYGLLLEIYFYRKNMIRFTGILATLVTISVAINLEDHTVEAAFLDVGQMGMLLSLAQIKMHALLLTLVDGIGLRII